MTNNYRICHVLTPSETNTRFICHVLTPSELFVNVYKVQISAMAFAIINILVNSDFMTLWGMNNKRIIEFGFGRISELFRPRSAVICLGLNNSDILLSLIQ